MLPENMQNPSSCNPSIGARHGMLADLGPAVQCMQPEPSSGQRQACT